MIRVFRILGCLGAAMAGSAVVAQTFDYPTFASVNGLTLNGAAAQVAGNLRVTNNGSGDTGSVWYSTPVPVTEGFETRFDFSMTPSPEGLAFVVHGAPAGAAALGGSLWGMGYGFGASTAPISNSIAFEIDAIQDTFLNDTSSNEVSIHTVGTFGNSENEGVSIARATPTADLSNNSVHSLRIRYVPGVLEVFLDNQATPLLSTAFTFQNGGTQLVGGNTGGLGLSGIHAWVGFTSATPSGTTGQNATVRSWNWVSYQLPNACYTGNVLAGLGGPYDLLTVNGSNGGFFRTMNLTVANPFTVAIAPPPGQANAPFVLLATLGIANAATVTATPFGPACFPLVAVVDIGSYVAPHSLAVPPGILLNVPLTLQAVMAAQPANPGVLELTNAVAMQFALAPPPVITSVTPNSTPVGGTITVNGNNFSAFATVDVNGNAIVPLTLTPTQLTFAMPAGVSCAATLRVRNPDGAAGTSAFNPTPVITNQVNTTGPAAGGTTYIAIGTGFAAGTTVTIGGVPANVTTAAATVITAITPPGQVGPRTIVITTPGGCSVTSTFTYF